MMHTLAVISPGHFHAALTLRQMHPDLSRDVYVYAEDGDDLKNFTCLVEAFNSRKENPTAWNLKVYAGGDFLERAVKDAKGDIAVLAGRNDRKIHYIKAMHDAGIKVLSDKPLTVDQRGVDILKELLDGGEVIADIMTERHEITSILQKELMAEKDIFGDLLRNSAEPAIVKESVHHLFKNVNGKPLVRPAWYFDVNAQGEGIVDVTTHLADLVQWMLLGERDVDFDSDYELCSAKHWSTNVPLEKFTLITKRENFQKELMPAVENNILKLYSNGEFTYKLRGIKVKLSVIWALEAPAGGGDTHYSVMRGTKADLIIEQGPQTGNRPELFVKPHGNIAEAEKLLRMVFEKQAHRGLGLMREGGRLRLEIPALSRSTHEEHFAAVRDDFIACLDGGKKFPANLRNALKAKYSLLAAAKKLASGK
ncbi:MAG: putative oxidoreductase C-terminal domain-containing protein [Victivallaceae bacterium]|nr:putative oxidoreductase C-terminal domain-containing protein [Victivallaceae bacterium]